MSRVDIAFTFSPYCMVLVKSVGKLGVFVVWQFGYMMVIWLCWVSRVCICRSILYRVSVFVPLWLFVRFVWQCLHVVGLCCIVWFGGCVIFRPWPLCPFCAPGCLPVFGRRVWGFFQGGSFDGGVELFLLFWFM